MDRMPSQMVNFWTVGSPLPYKSEEFSLVGAYWYTEICVFQIYIAHVIVSFQVVFYYLKPFHFEVIVYHVPV